MHLPKELQAGATTAQTTHEVRLVTGAGLGRGVAKSAQLLFLRFVGTSERNKLRVCVLCPFD